MQGRHFTESTEPSSLKFFPDRPDMPIDELMNDLNRDEDEEDPNDRRPQRLLDSRIQHDGELSDSEDEGDGRRDHASHRGRGHSSDSDNKLKFGMSIGILASSSASMHGAGPSGHTTAVRMLSSSNIPADEEASTEVPDGDLDMDLDTPSSVQENGAKVYTANGRSATPPSSSSPKDSDEKEEERGMDDMTLDDAHINTVEGSSTPPLPPLDATPMST